MSSDSRAFAYAYINPAVRSDRLRCIDMEHTMKPFDHDLLRFKVQGVDDTDQTRWTTGVPVRIQYGRWPLGVTNFFGYIGGVNRTWDQSVRTGPSGRVMEVWCIGASYPLKAPITTIFTGMTSSQIASSVASASGLDIDIPPTAYTWPQKSAPGLTQWKFLSELALASGCTLYVNRTQMRFYDPSTILQRNNLVVPIFYEKDAALSQAGGAATVVSLHTDVTELSAVEGRRKRNRVVQGIDAVTGAPIFTTSAAQAVPSMASRTLAPIFAEAVTDLVTRSQADAVALLPARTAANRFHIRGKAILSGDVRVTQESPIVIEGLGTRDSGVWQVIEACHIVRKNWYSTECVLGRDSDYDNGVRPGLPPGVAATRLTTTAASGAGEPPSVLLSGQWRAAYTSFGALSAAA
jgi:phage protein D